jgi:putative ABC transport system permease protein
MTLWMSVLSSIQSLLTNKMRSALTMLGIVIGVSSVVFLVSFGKGHEAFITKMFTSMGANALYITSVNMSDEMSGGVANLTMEDAESLADPNKAPSVSVVAPYASKMVTVSYENTNKSVSLMGVTPDIRNVLDYSLDAGEFISEQDVRKATNVAVLGSKTYENFFGSDNAIGETIRVAGRKFEIIGVLEGKGAFMAGMDDFIMIPLTTMQSRILTQTSARGRPVQTIAVRAVVAEEIDNAREQVATILRQRHHIKTGDDDDFSVMDMREIIESMQLMLQVFQIFLGSVGAISLIVGGIGIMNIMLVSVAERTREIGIRKAVGAKRGDILRQFLVESAMLSLSGGIIGMLLAGLGSIAIGQLNRFVDLEGYTASAPISADIVIIALSIAIFIGLVSGSYPAYRAARLDPITSLRHE